MDEMELFTINVFQSRDRKEPEQDDANDANGTAIPMEEEANKLLGEFQNMVSARVIKGRMLELEHSSLAGPDVKFKTVINYERILKPNSFIGVSFKSQDGYITKPDE